LEVNAEFVRLTLNARLVPASIVASVVAAIPFIIVSSRAAPHSAIKEFVLMSATKNNASSYIRRLVYPLANAVHVQSTLNARQVHASKAGSVVTAMRPILAFQSLRHTVMSAQEFALSVLRLNARLPLKLV
jgi:hypothetical protein